jgi:hypothetical protein
VAFFCPFIMVYKVIRIFIGTIFIVSAYTKQYSIEGLETQVYDYLSNWKIAGLAARGLIFIEYFIGFSFIVIYRRWLVWMAVGLISGFTLFLGIQIATGHNLENCGCFGELIEMSSIESLIKNFVILALLIVLLYKHCASIWQKWAKLIFIGSFSLSVVGLMYYSPYSLDSQSTEKTWNTTLLENEINFEVPNSGLIVFFATKCKHCKSAAIRLNKLNHSAHKILLILMTEKEIDAINFIESTNVRFKHFMLPVDKFLNFNGSILPGLFAVKDGEISKYWNGRNLNASAYQEIDVFLKDVK